MEVGKGSFIPDNTSFVAQRSSISLDGDNLFNKQLEEGILNPSEFTSPLSTDFRVNFQKLLERQGPLFLRIKGVDMSLKIEESPIYDENELRTQIHDPIFAKEELSKHKDKKHYSITMGDPYRPMPEGLLELIEKNHVLQAIHEQGGKATTKQEEEILKEALLQEGDLETALMMNNVNIESLKSVYDKPAISIRISEDGGIGEIASIASQSGALSGSDLMGGVDDFCKMLGVKHMYLEDDAKITKPGVEYNLRLFRLIGSLDKNSWYEILFR